MNARDLKNWTKGNPLSADHLDEAIRFLKSSGEVTAGPGLGVYTGSGATVVSPIGTRLKPRTFWGKITATGPSGQADYGNNLYWVTGQFLKPTADPTTVPVMADDVTVFGLDDGTATNDDTEGPTPKYWNTVTVSNMGEQFAASHSLAYGTVVYVWEEFERCSGGDDSGAYDQTAGVSRWVMFVPDVGRPQYDGMMLQGGQNQRFWDFPRAHSMA